MVNSIADVDSSIEIAEQVRDAFEKESPVCLTGSGSKRGEGRAVDAVPVHLTGHCGIIEYSPTELVITARAGTSRIIE